MLADDDQWEDRVALIPTHAGNDQKVEFLLYKNGGSEPYRSLHVRLDVEGAATEESQPRAAPLANPLPRPALEACGRHEECSC